MKSRGFVPRKPRISRSRVIARRGEKRVAASSPTGTKARPRPSGTSERMSAILGKVRASDYYAKNGLNGSGGRRNGRAVGSSSEQSSALSTFNPVRPTSHCCVVSFAFL